jgi:hypothetical protein
LPPVAASERTKRKFRVIDLDADPDLDDDSDDDDKEEGDDDEDVVVEDVVEGDRAG